MIGTMRKHSAILWWGIIVIVVFAFVIWGTGPSGRGGGRVGLYGRINGQPVTEADIVAARNEVKLGYFLRFGEWPGVQAEQMGFDLQREIFVQLLRTQLLQQRYMYAGAEAKAAAAANLLGSLKAQGAKINTLADFEMAVLKDQGMSLADLDRFLEHRIALLQLTSVEGLPGRLITPQQVEALWKRDNQEIQVQAVFFSGSNYVDSVEVTSEAVANYFTNQIARYRIPEKLQVRYVAFPISNYFAQADQRLASLTNLSAQIEEEYARRGTNAYPGLTSEEAKEQIRNELRRLAAVHAASREAAAFADELWRQEPMKPEDMNTIGTQRGLTVKVSTSFDRASTPPELDVDSRFTQAAFALRPDEPFAGPIEGDSHVYVITLDQRIPSKNAEFEQVKEQVTADYKLQQATSKARTLGGEFANALTNRLASGEPFTKICAEVGYVPQTLPPFSRSTRSLPEIEQHTTLGRFKQIAFDTPVGQASPFALMPDGGYLVYVAERLPIDEAEMKKALPEYTQLVRQALESDAYSVWFGQEAEAGLQETPLAQRPPPQMSSPGG